jgi:hypothetical protein
MTKRKARTLPVLAEHGVVRRGTEIEMISSVRPPDADQHDPRAFRATVEDTRGLRQSIRWALDGKLYSLSSLTRVVQDRFGGSPDLGLYFSNWQRVGATETLHHEAERFPR